MSHNGMTPKFYPVLLEALERGIRYGIRRAHKHVAEPTDDEMLIAIQEAVMNELDEWFDIPTEVIYGGGE